MNQIKTIFASLVLLLGSVSLYAQNGDSKSVIGETMRSNGRIYVVVAVMLVILAGLIIYLVRLDRKMSRIEKEG